MTEREEKVSAGTDEVLVPSWWQRILQARGLSITVSFLLIIIISASLSPLFLTSKNIESALLVFFVEYAFCTVAETLVLIVRGIDLSLAGIFGLVTICTALAYQAGVNIWLATILGLSLGAACGLLNGFFVTKIKLPAFIATMASGLLFTGTSLGITAGRPISNFPPEFLWLGQGYLGPFPTQLLVLAVVAVLAHLILTYTRYGRWLYAIGGNEIAARFSGIPTDRVVLVVFMCSGLLASMAAIITSARFNLAKADLGINIELATITAALLGGVSIDGGVGSIPGALLGMLAIAALQNGMLLAGATDYVQVMIVSSMLIVLVVFEKYMAQRRIA